MALNYVKPAQAAAELGLSRSTVYSKVRKRILPFRLEDGKIMVGIEESLVPEPPKPIPVEPSSAPPSVPLPSGGQRDLVIRPRESARIAFFQVPTWL